MAGPKTWPCAEEIPAQGRAGQGRQEGEGGGRGVFMSRVRVEPVTGEMRGLPPASSSLLHPAVVRPMWSCSLLGTFAHRTMDWASRETP